MHSMFDIKGKWLLG